MNYLIFSSALIVLELPSIYLLTEFQIALPHLTSFKSKNVSQTNESCPGREFLFLGKYPIPADTSDPINIDTSKAHPEDLSPLILSANGNIPLLLENTGKAIQAVPHYYNSKHYLTGGPLGKTRYRYWLNRIFAIDDPDTMEGMSINNKGTPLGCRVYFLNNKYTDTEALKNRDGVAVLVILTPSCKDNKTNEDFIPLYNAMRKIKMPGSSVNITLSVLLQAKDGVKRFSEYYAYPGPYIDQDENKYFCATVIVFPIIEANCISREQLLQSIALMKNSEGGILRYHHWQYNATMPIVKGRGFCQKS